MSIVPPARSIRVGADAVMRTRHIIILLRTRLRSPMPLATSRDIGQLLIGSFPGPALSVEFRALAREFGLGGAILFSRNVEAPAQVAELAADIEELGRDLALKVMNERLRGLPALERRFLEEVHICGRLSHPYIVPFHSAGQLEDGRPYYLMNLVVGRTLREELRTSGRVLPGAMRTFSKPVRPPLSVTVSLAVTSPGCV